MLEYKSLPLDGMRFNETPDGFTISGYITTPHMDRRRDIVPAGAADKWLKLRHFDEIAQGKPSGVRFLWQHKQDEIIGQPTLIRSDENGVYVEASFIVDPDFPQAVRAYKLAKWGLLKDFSIGYLTIQEKMEEDENGPYRILEELDIQEFSLVTIPMNPHAVVTDVKAAAELVKDEVDVEEIKSLREEVAALREVVNALVVGLSAANQPAESPAAEEVPEQKEAELEVAAEEPAVEQTLEEKETLVIQIPDSESEPEDESPAEDQGEPGEEPLEMCGMCPHCGGGLKLCKDETKAACKPKMKAPMPAVTTCDASEVLDSKSSAVEDVDLQGLLQTALELKSIINGRY